MEMLSLKSTGLIKRTKLAGDFHGGAVVKTLPSNAGDVGSSSHMPHGQNETKQKRPHKTKQYCNKFNIHVLVAQLCRFFATTWTVFSQTPLSMGILQARILQWVASPISRGSSWPRDWVQVSYIAGRFFTLWTRREAQIQYRLKKKKNKVVYSGSSLFSF